jgi:hypothetical protein
MVNRKNKKKNEMKIVEKKEPRRFASSTGKGLFSSIGNSGTEVFGGYFSEEYLQILRGNRAAELFDKMRRSDGQIKMLLSIVKNPILSASWFFDPFDDSDEQKEMAEFCEHVFFKDMGSHDKMITKSWTDFLEEALTSLDFGFSLFEIVNKIVLNHPKWGNYVGIKNLGFRSQKTIENWYLRTDGAIKSVRQMTQGDLSIGQTSFEMDGQHLVCISINKEGDNYEGISTLRPIYGNWFRKNIYRKLQAIGIERGAVGSLKGVVPAGKESDKETEYFQDALESFTSNERGFITLPEGYQIESLKVEFDAEKVQAVIDGENREMAKSFIASFMELGLSGSGSQALGGDISNIFLGSIEFYATKIREALNARVVPLIIGSKYGPQENYPKLSVTGIKDKAGKEFAEILKLMSEADLIEKSDKLKKFIHKTYRLPDFISEDGELEGEVNPVEEEKVETQMSEVIKLSNSYQDRINSKKVIEEDSKQLEKFMKKSLHDRSEKMIDEIGRIFDKNSVKQTRYKAFRLSLTGEKEYKNQLLVMFDDIANDAQRATLKEIGEPQNKKFAKKKKLFKGLPKDLKEKITSEVDLIVASQDADMKKQILFTFSAKVDNEASAEKLVQEMKRSRDAYLEGPAVTAGSSNFVSEIVNKTRFAIFQEPEFFEEIESFMFFNPDAVSAICQNLHGKVFKKGDPDANEFLPPLHHNCKSIIVPQWAGDKKNVPLPTAKEYVGLMPTGTEEEVARAMKSKGF